MYLVIAIQWKYRGSIGGMAQRFVFVAMELYDMGYNVKCLTTYSLLEHLGIENHPALIIIDDRKYRFIRLFGKILTLWKFLFFNKIKGIHLSGGEKSLKYLINYAQRKDVILSCTFASRTLEMAAYDNEKEIQAWIEKLNKVDKIDVLNPGHNLLPWKDKISVSPCSFPSRLIHYSGDLKNNKKEDIAVFSGALVSTKNPILACQIIENALESGVLKYGFELYIFGRGVLEKDIQVFSEKIQKKFNYKVVIFGKQEDYFNILSKAKIFFSLQEYDNYPSQSLMEAMFFGANCVCTADGDTKLLVDYTENNVVLNSRRADNFVQAIDKINFNYFNYYNYDVINKYFNIKNFSQYMSEFLSVNNR